MSFLFYLGDMFAMMASQREVASIVPADLQYKYRFVLLNQDDATAGLILACLVY